MKRRQPDTMNAVGDEGRAFGSQLARALDSMVTIAAEGRRDEDAARARLVELALAEAPAFLERVFTEATGIAQGFNAELGDARLAVRASDHIVTVADDRWSGSVAVIALLPRGHDPIEPYLIVHSRQQGSGGQVPWSFVDQDGALLVCRGHDEPLTAEAFTRAIVGPWLTRLPMTPRVLVASIPSALPRESL